MSVRRKQRIFRTLTVIAIFAAAALIFWYFLRYLTSEPSAPRESEVVGYHAVLSCTASPIMEPPSSELG
jgi:hypothetical protein